MLRKLGMAILFAIVGIVVLWLLIVFTYLIEADRLNGLVSLIGAVIKVWFMALLTWVACKKLRG